jgi:hypothetical protein
MPEASDLPELPDMDQMGQTDATPAAEVTGSHTGDELEEILARLVAAGIDRPAALAQLLGVDETFIGRPSRALLRSGIVETDAAGGLHLTPRGEAWLQLSSDAVAAEPFADVSALELPALEPLPPALEPVPERTSKKARRALFGLRLPRQLSGAHLFGRHPFGALGPQPTVARSLGVRLAWLPAPVRNLPRLAAHRRVALVGASALLVIVAGKTGLYSFGGPPGVAAQAARAQVTATATPWTIADLSTPARPTPTLDSTRWMVVQHTNGLGLVLRPAPASTARVILLEEGARLRITGGSVEQDGHAWLPVTSADGASGWVAGEFLAPAR